MLRSEVRQRLALMLVTNSRLVEQRRDSFDLGQLTAAALRGGVTAVQLREKDQPARRILLWARELRWLTRRAGALLLINDRVDVALAVAADGVHLGQGSLDPATARRLLGPEAVVGVSVHNAIEMEQALATGAVDYVVFGHVFATASKPGLAPRGLEALRTLAAQSPLPVLGIGGITPENAHRVVAAGACGVAVMSALLLAPDPARQAAALRRALVRGGLSHETGG